MSICSNCGVYRCAFGKSQMREECSCFIPKDDFIRRSDVINAYGGLLSITHGGRDFQNKVRFINQIPAADVRENKKGTWISVDGHWECSVCRHPRFHDLFLGVDASFCGCCGADLRDGL